MNDPQIQHLITAITQQQRILRVLFEHARHGVKLSPAGAEEAAQAMMSANSEIVKARAVIDEDATLSLR